ncbi:MFS superfamily sulfate permease-like transporter [Wenyingzhuangia heitensis]|uniref:MFS superfamily sulfate permease-like transporter n=1 Tax=Wenyingzhuangia heitensis TaxID=1487859 RepID=A0ABX0UH54_9FLAO|nr:SulP family inorganic anion transporter [Wenyingzhuangia heitensis]NIJ46516.1 MFS superfamily sulfate permease-like transporter [Wenyingzhuangia heitensis]
MPQQKESNQFLAALPQNIFSGFVVSLIALPLGLGLALASEAPPISGVISAVVGGVIVAIFGGSNVTITGPGNGLVVVLLTAITTLGHGDLQLGFAYTLAAIVVSGAIMILLGFLRLGILSDFFPSTAIQGMLAAIGIGIFAKQFHVMLGNSNEDGGLVELLLEIPKTIQTFIVTENHNFFYAGIVGLVSLFIMIFHAKIRNKYFQLIPAPMWIVVFAVGLSYFFQLVLKQEHPIDKAWLINIPDDVFSNLAFPNFGKAFNAEFITAVISITLIASIESLLSIKAVDQLDPLKRRSNVNRDLKALGLATMTSGFLGGLNVVTVIARSSVNVNNKATNRSANLFHALFLLAFLILFQTQLKMIPLSALAAILVYTGYKLAAPKNILAVSKVGYEQLVIFFATLLTTIFTSLIIGILVGIFATFVVHIIVNKGIIIFVRNTLKPNVLMYKERDGSYYVSVKNFSSFINFYRLKNKLNLIPEHENVVVDFSRCRFVDNTVMENIHTYVEKFESKQGNLEVVGLDMHGAGTLHPFAPRNINKTPQKDSELSLTKRQKNLAQIANDFGWEYTPFVTGSIALLSDFNYFKTRRVERTKNLLKNGNDKLFDVVFTEGAFIARQLIRSTVFHVKVDDPIPNFTLDKEGLFEYVKQFTNFADIEVENHPDFNKRFYLSGEDRQAVLDFFTDEIILFLESNIYYHIESNQNGLLIFKKERLASVKEIKAMIDFGLRFEKLIKETAYVRA